MLVPESVMKQLDVDAAAAFCLKTPLDRMPLLISDRGPSVYRLCARSSSGWRLAWRPTTARG